MAATLVTVGVVNDDVFVAPSQSTPVVDLSIPLDNSYPAGGYLGVETLLQKATKDKRAIVEILTPLDKSGLFPVWDEANSKLMLFRCGGAAANAVEVANAVDLSAVTLRLRILCQ